MSLYAFLCVPLLPQWSRCEAEQGIIQKDVRWPQTFSYSNWFFLVFKRLRVSTVYSSNVESHRFSHSFSPLPSSCVHNVTGVYERKELISLLECKASKHVLIRWTKERHKVKQMSVTSVDPKVTFDLFSVFGSMLLQKKHRS